MEKPNAGELLRNARKMKGVSISKLAELTGVSQPYLSQIENNKRNPSYEIIHKIKSVLDIDFYLFAWASNLFTDEEYQQAISQKGNLNSMTPEEEADYLDAQIYAYSLDEFQQTEYPQIEDFLKSKKDFYVNKYKLNSQDKELLYKVALALFGDRTPNYPSDEEIEKAHDLHEEWLEEVRKAMNDDKWTEK